MRGPEDGKGIRADILRVMCPSRRVLAAPIEALSRLNLDHFPANVHLKSCFLLRRKDILRHSYEETGFADAAITEEYGLVVRASFRVSTLLASALGHGDRLRLLPLRHGPSGLGLARPGIAVGSRVRFRIAFFDEVKKLL